MLNNFTPFTYFFILVYCCLLFCLLSLQDFFSIWILIELVMLVFLGIGYTILTSGFSSVMQYFLVQTLASFSIFIFYFLGLPVLLTFSFLIKLAMFPFFSWFFSLVPRFPNFLFFLSSTLHNLPPFYLILVIPSCLSVNLLFSSAIFSLLVSGLVIMTLSDLRFLLVVSSVGNNSWFLLSLLQGPYMFYFFFICYFISFLFVILFFRSSSSLPTFSSSFIFSLVSLSGFPPSPLFFANAYLVFLCFSISYSILLLLVFAALVLVAYIRSLFHFISFSFASYPQLFLLWEVSLFNTLVFNTN